MFTGLVEEKGSIQSVSESAGTADIAVRAAIVSADATIGDSVAINGCCLTVVAIDGEVLTFQAGTETLSRTNLGQLKTGSPVNLERALKAGDRMGGHYVSGHVDAIGLVDERNEDGQWAEFWFKVPSDLTRQMASKGSITVDGISLTLVNVEKERFSVALIPHTLNVTTLGQRAIGDQVNIETDLLAKYVQQQMDRSGS
ncbi:MAG: riboflavin synthase [Mariniblastus sp.]